MTTQTIPRLFTLVGLTDRVDIVDVGANPIDGDPPYKPLLVAGGCTVIGFEPQPSALADLLARKGPNETYLPHALGDGGAIDLNICLASGMTSALKPDRNTLGLFSRLQRLAQVRSVERIETRRLDDVAEIGRMDVLKIDVQGYELTIVRNGLDRLADTALVQIEVSFMPLYEGQPTFGEVDVFFRAQGFVPHCFAALKKWPIAPSVINGDDARPLNQLLEADVVYVRDFTAAGRATDRQLRVMAVTAHHCYRSYDLTARCIQILEERGAVAGGALNTYVTTFFGR